MTTETKATSLHDKILRMPHGTNEAVYAERSDWLAYKTGHRDARHAAAELAIGSDQEIEDLNSRITAFQQAIDEANRRLDQREAHVAQLVEALERISLYRAFNGDDWPAQHARAALLSHKGER